MTLTDITPGEWYADMGAWAGVALSAGVLWRMIIWPGLRAMWAAIKAAPEIPLILDDVREILRSDVVGGLEEMKAQLATHEVESQMRDARLDQHSVAIEEHSIVQRDLVTRLGKVEEILEELVNEGR